MSANNSLGDNFVFLYILFGDTVNRLSPSTTSNKTSEKVSKELSKELLV